MIPDPTVICDRCGNATPYVQAPGTATNKLNHATSLWPSTALATAHERTERRIDLCMTCWEGLAEWLVEGSPS